MTISKPIAEQLAADVKFNAAVMQASPEDALRLMAEDATKDGWAEKWLSPPYFDEAGNPAPHIKYSNNDWLTHYFNARQSATGKRNPLFFGEHGKTVDVTKVGIIEVPRASLDNGALLADFDLGRSVGLEEVRSYGDVNLTPTAAAPPPAAAGWTAHTTDEFAEAVMKAIRGEPLEPDVEIAVAEFAKQAQLWGKTALKEVFEGNEGAADLFKGINGLPIEQGRPYNQTEQLFYNQVGNAMNIAAEDAFRLQYFAKERTFLERSLNHPFFGIYPASYMFGKILPEMARFTAQSPFGVRTGAFAYGMHDLQVSLATQRELDPEFDEMMDRLGRSAVARFINLIINTPWNVGASLPAWARDIAEQGNDNQARVDRGEDPKPVDLSSPLTRISDYVSPTRPGKQLEGLISEVGDIIFGTPEQQKERAVAAEKAAKLTPAQTLEPSLNTAMDDLRAVLGLGTPQPAMPALVEGDDDVPDPNTGGVSEERRLRQNAVRRINSEKERMAPFGGPVSNLIPDRFRDDVKLDPSQVEWPGQWKIPAEEPPALAPDRTSPWTSGRFGRRNQSRRKGR